VGKTRFHHLTQSFALHQHQDLDPARTGACPIACQAARQAGSRWPLFLVIWATVQVRLSAAAAAKAESLTFYRQTYRQTDRKRYTWGIAKKSPDGAS
jgi:hypothetical protein